MSLAADIKVLKATFAAGMNMVVAVGASFGIGFYVGRQSDGQDRTVLR